jgi:hypothetical protein
MCRSQLAVLVGYLCNACEIDFHEACAGYFKEVVAFFKICQPWHGLKLSRILGSRPCLIGGRTFF